MTLNVIFFRSRWASPSSWCNLVFSITGWPLYNSKSFIPHGSASPFGRITIRPSTFAIAPGSCTTRRSSPVNPPADISGEQNELAGMTKRTDAGSDEAPTRPEASILPLVPPPAKDLFTKFMKVFMKTTQAQALAEPQECLPKARTPETYLGKSHMECYHFCQQCEDYFETSGATGINRTPFAPSFLRGSISLRWAQHKRCHESSTPITWSEFKAFLQKDFGSSQAFIDSIWSKFRRDS